MLVTHPQLAREWHLTKNKKTPQEVTAGSAMRVWWQCLNNIEHIWPTRLVERTSSMSRCPFCLKRKAIASNSLAITHPDIAAEWHPTKNTKTPYELTSISNEKIWWKCPLGDDHEWETTVEYRVKKGAACQICINRKVVESNCLKRTHPEIAKEWHPTKNGDLTSHSVTAGYNNKVWWVCTQNTEHEWPAKVYDRTKLGKGKCPYCQPVWSIEKIKFFVKSLLSYIDKLTPAELYVIFQQNGILTNQSKAKAFTDILKTGKFPKEELEKFVNGEASIIDALITDDPTAQNQPELNLLKESISTDNLSEDPEELPLIETEDVLSSLDSNKLISNVDEEVVEFFINSAIAKIWKHVFVNEKQAIDQLNNYHPGDYATEVKNRFLEQYNGAKDLIIPPGYAFRSEPNLMQRYTAYLLSQRKKIGNWSGTGAGKTLSAVLSSRVINAKLTLICCPNSVISGWHKAIHEIYPDSVTYIKDIDVSIPSQAKQHHYLVLNYEFFQQPRAENRLKKFIAAHKVDFIVIDEIHFSKQRVSENVSKRKQVISALLSEASQTNPNLYVLGMSATPVINNLFEGKTLIELITGINHDDLNTVATINNCISLYQKMVVHGIRWMPKYPEKLNTNTVEIDCSDYLEEIKLSSATGTMVELEAVLTQAKLPTILDNIKPKTIIYTHFLKKIIAPLFEAVEACGWKAAIYSGDDKSGLDNFIYGNADVLIATSCLSTGVDGLQTVCNRIIINTLPWTHAEFEQLKGRVYRQGQKQDVVDIIVPLTYAIINEERWSWCDSRWKRIQFKKSIADAAVDGIIPEGSLRTPAQAYQDAINWLNRLEHGQLNEIEREKIILSLSEDELKIGYRKFGDFSNMNRLINTTSSAVMHDKFKNNPKDWEYYHELYREARKEWNIVPYKEAAKWCKARPHLTIGDFGCGEALLAKEVDNTVYSIDHIAINEHVISCDMAHTPLEDESLDAAIFSLSLMGSNHIDYLKESHRCLKLDGHLWIAETTSRFPQLALESELAAIGFDIIRISEKGRFTFLKAIKSDF